MALHVSTNGATSIAVQTVIGKLVEDRVASRIAAKDFTLWGKPAEAESSIRLGWVNSASDSESLVAGILSLREEFLSKGVDRFVLCGMGGSSLAPEVITKTAGVPLVVLDSTNPEQVAQALSLDIEKTAVIVSSKSGSTVETDSQKRLFEKAFTDAGINKTDRIVIVTDPGSPMEQAAKADGYRIFNADPTVGGRYSALTAFGMVPSGLAGADIQQLLTDAKSAALALAKDTESNPGLQLGAVLANTHLSSARADKVGIVEGKTSVHGFGDWAEQLIAESTGKDSLGVLPVVLENNAPELAAHASDLVVARIYDVATDAEANEVSVAGSLGEQFMLWEYATVIASRLIGINPFDQPDVESAKIAARGMLESRAEVTPADSVVDGIEIRQLGVAAFNGESVEDAIASLLGSLADDGYVSVHAYIDRENNAELAKIRSLLAAKSQRPTTFGWAPRFLHSTGQYHKGGPAQGVYLQIVSKPTIDIPVPGRDFTLGELIASQAAGDAAVLAEHGRPVLTLTITDVKKDIQNILSKI
jgi:glucose-6-phosphate isomerase